MAASFFERDVHDPQSYTPNPHYERSGRVPGGTQGTLFNVQQFPRGYGPARQRRIGEALANVEVETSGIKPTGSKFKGNTKAARAAKEEYRSRWSRALGENLKRSTVPASHLEALEQIRLGTTAGANVHGSYDPLMRSMRLTAESRWVKERKKSIPDVNEDTMLHEIGHHVDLALSTPHISESREFRDLVERPADRSYFESAGRRQAFEDPTAYAQQRIEATESYAHGHLIRSSSRTGLEEATADYYRQLHKPETPKGYSPKGVARVATPSSSRYTYGDIGTNAENAKLAQHAYVHQMERLGQFPVNPHWSGVQDVTAYRRKYPGGMRPLQEEQFKLFHTPATNLDLDAMQEETNRRLNAEQED